MENPTTEETGRRDLEEDADASVVCNKDAQDFLSGAGGFAAGATADADTAVSAEVDTDSEVAGAATSAISDEA